MPPPAVARSKYYFPVIVIRILAGGLLALMSPSLSAKDLFLNAIVLYDAANGAAYVQMTNLTLNGKVELRTCAPDVKIDKSAYGKLGKVQMKGAVSLERSAQGVLILTRDEQSFCVLPSNLRFEKKSRFSPAELADQAVLEGTVLSSSEGQPAEVPPLKPGVRVIFVATPDTELAEFLRAQRARSIAGWHEYLSRYRSAPHSSEARNSLAALLEEFAETSFAQHQKAAGAAAWASLKQARDLTDQATHTVPTYAPALKLLEKIRGELETFTASDRSELLAYRKALLEQAAGYTHLASAKDLNRQILDVDASYGPALELESDINKEQSALDLVVDKSETLLNSKRYDEALLGLGPYRVFAAEIPRIDAVVAAVYSVHFSRGKEFSAQQNWDKAVPEFRKALEAHPDSQEARAALSDAEIQLTNTHNREAAERAAEESKAYVGQKQYIEAYEVLANLPDAQRALVADQIEALTDSYVPAAVQRAQTLQEVHVPIRGRADEDAVREAYRLLARASSLSDDHAVRLKRDLLSDKISSYYVAQAKRYLEKPMASGVGLGWCYLGEAQRYKQNLDTVRDEMTRYESAYQLRAKVSIGVVIRDQTSRRESVGFADQLADAISTDLELSGLLVKVVRQAAGIAPSGEPIFLLVGEINQHRIVKHPTLETLQSKYRAGIREVKNEAWLKASREYESAQQDVNAAQRTLEQAIGGHNKKKIASARDALSAFQKKASDLRTNLDAIDQTRAQDVIEPYNYTKTTIGLTGIIDLAFRIVDLNGNLIEPTTPLKQESHKVYYVLENVKPEDTEGVKAQNAPPDEGAFITDLELQARDALIKAIQEKVLRLPAKILDQARKRAQQNDLEGAAESYVIYLNATPETSSPERDEATKFLRDHFNVSLASAS
jgi:hypothetical protein